MSGSFKKVSKVNQRVHRERSQPEHRAKFGLLEKHKDYVERAREHHTKRDKIKALKRKAADKNKDEFYFNMVSTEKVDGVHQRRKEKKDKVKGETTTEDQELLIMRQDLRYVQAKHAVELKKIEKLQADLHLLDPRFRVNKHTLFVDDEKDVPSGKSRLNAIQEETRKILTVTPDQQKEMEKNYGLLNKRLNRLKELRTIEEKLEMRLHLKKDPKGKKKLVKAETKDSAAVYRWCFLRKR